MPETVVDPEPSYERPEFRPQSLALAIAHIVGIYVAAVLGAATILLGAWLLAGGAQ
jgi:hypothetical protein